MASRKSGQGRQFEWRDKATWDAALEGVSGVYLVSPGGDASSAMIEFAAHARTRGCRRFVLLSASLVPAGAPGLGQVHAWLAANTSEWGVLRPSWFMENFWEGHHAASISEEACIYSATEDGRVGFVSVRDIAAVAAAMLTAEEAPNTDAVLTGPEAISYDQAASTLSGVLGREIRHVRIGVEALAARHIARGMPSAVAQVVAGMDAMIASGAEDRVTEAVRRYSARDPIGLDACCRAAAAV